MHSGGMFIRKGKGGRILLLGGESPGIKGRIALARRPCADWHIAVKAYWVGSGRINLELGARYAEVTSWDDDLRAFGYTVIPGEPGSFRIGLRWHNRFNPYDGTIEMEAWAFGMYLGTWHCPKAPNDPLWIADVEVMGDGRVEVNGQNTGYWPELLA